MNVSEIPVEAQASPAVPSPAVSSPAVPSPAKTTRGGEAIYYASVLAFYLCALVWLPLLLSAAGCAH